MMRYRFHFLGMPHTSTSPDYCHCAYTSKVVKALKMFSRRGHTCFDYSNAGAVVPHGVEHVDIFTEEERASYFGPHEKNKLYDIVWDPSKPYWLEYNRRLVEALKPRVQKGDFLMTLSGNCQVGPVGDAFPGSYKGIAYGPMLVEWGIGYFGTQSVYRIFESHGHREWVMGRADWKTADYSAAVVPNFFDMDDFPEYPPPTERTKPIIDAGPYYLFIGRVILDKGVDVALEVVRDLGGARLVIAGQGEWPDLPPNVVRFGHANIEERASLMANAIAVLNPTKFREPFGGTAVEAQLSGTPAITTDSGGAFYETTRPHWRCASHREFVEAARAAQHLTSSERRAIRARARGLYSLEAVAPLYERYFGLLYSRWWGGYYEMRDLEGLELP